VSKGFVFREGPNYSVMKETRAKSEKYNAVNIGFSHKHSTFAK